MEESTIVELAGGFTSYGISPDEQLEPTHTLADLERVENQPTISKLAAEAALSTLVQTQGEQS